LTGYHVKAPYGFCVVQAWPLGVVCQPSPSSSARDVGALTVRGVGDLDLVRRAGHHRCPDEQVLALVGELGRDAVHGQRRDVHALVQVEREAGRGRRGLQPQGRGARQRAPAGLPGEVEVVAADVDAGVPLGGVVGVRLRTLGRPGQPGEERGARTEGEADEGGSTGHARSLGPPLECQALVARVSPRGASSVRWWSRECRPVAPRVSGGGPASAGSWSLGGGLLESAGQSLALAQPRPGTRAAKAWHSRSQGLALARVGKGVSGAGGR
jgi:hypothetical protein